MPRGATAQDCHCAVAQLRKVPAHEELASPGNGNYARPFRDFRDCSAAMPCFTLISSSRLVRRCDGTMAN
jgi:hypothetical protein